MAAYFQSTIAHNTVEIDGQWQSVRGGAFLWLRHATGREIEVAGGDQVVSWIGEHDGYRAARPPAVHRRMVRLDRAAETLEITDEINGGGHDIRVAYHLGPLIDVTLNGSVAELTWSAGTTRGSAVLELPGQLQWKKHQGETNPILGWFSARLGQRVLAVTLLGEGRTASGVPLSSRLKFYKS